MVTTRIQRGFTLVEMIVVIVITGILAGMVAVFIRAPVQGYMDSSNRARMSDIADTALRRIGRDIRAAVPNSVRVPNPGGTSTYIEFLPTRDGGRYRASNAGSSNVCGGTAKGDALSFDAVDTCFSVIGPDIALASGDAIIIGSTQSNGSLPYLDVTSINSVRRMVPAAGAGTGQKVQFTSTVKWPYAAELADHRFAVVPAAEQAVTYGCMNLGTNANGDGAGTLTRYWGYGYNPSQQAPPLTGGSSAILADNVSYCRIVYNTADQRNGLVEIWLEITRHNERIRLYHEIHVNNIP